MQINELNQTLNMANSEKNEVKFKHSECQKQLNLKIEHLNEEVEGLNNQLAKAENSFFALKNSSSQIQLDLENEVTYLKKIIQIVNFNFKGTFYF